MLVLALAGALSQKASLAQADGSVPTAQVYAVSGSERQSDIATYRMRYRAFVQMIAFQDDAFDTYERLAILTPDEVAKQFPHGNHGQVLRLAKRRFTAAKDQALMEQQRLEQHLLVLTGGRIPSMDELATLHAAIGL